MELMTYSKWEDIPEGIATKTTLYRDYGLNLADGQKPVARKKRYDHKGRHVGYYDLYAADEAVPRKKATAAQLKALEKARYMAEKMVLVCSTCERVQRDEWRNAIKVTRKQYIDNGYKKFVCHFCRDKEAAVSWARNLLEYDDFVILDTETADLHGEIIEIAVIDSSGEPILNQRIKPVGEIASGAEAVHGISLDDLKDCPTFPEVYPDIVDAIAGQAVIIYNAPYDTACIERDCERHQLGDIPFETACAMSWYAQYCGDWSRKYNDYKFQPLDGGHSALSDCRATLALLKTMTGDCDE